MKAKRFKQMKDERMKIAQERIDILDKMKARRPDFEKRYELLIKRISKKYRLNI
ncbi:MAG: hypothetical protein V1818_02935 [Candidatus Aenigmatarchaeota archaeon]